MGKIKSMNGKRTRTKRGLAGLPPKGPQRIPAADVFGMARSIVAQWAPKLMHAGMEANKQHDGTHDHYVAAGVHLMNAIIGDQLSNMLRGFVFDFDVSATDDKPKSKVQLALGDYAPTYLKTVKAEDVTEFEVIADKPSTHYAVFYFPIRVTETEHKPSDDLVKPPVKRSLILPGGE